MKEIKKIFQEKKHRPFPMPTKKWSYYQEWNQAIFLHWKIPLYILKKYVPNQLHIDTFDGNAYISLVAFTMEKIRPRFLPSVKYISDFDEINLRTYVDIDNKKGVYFLSIEAGNQLSAWIAKKLSGLPYEKSNINRKNKQYISSNSDKNFNLNILYNTKKAMPHKSDIDLWLTERYCLYLEDKNNLYRYDIHHKEWEIKKIQIEHLSLQYHLGDFHLTETPDYTHYSDGIKVIAWSREKIINN